MIKVINRNFFATKFITCDSKQIAVAFALGLLITSGIVFLPCIIQGKVLDSTL